MIVFLLHDFGPELLPETVSLPAGEMGKDAIFRQETRLEVAGSHLVSLVESHVPDSRSIGQNP